MTGDYDVYDEDEELHDTIRAHLEGKLEYFDYIQTLMMLGKSEADVKDDVERIRAEIEAEKAPKPKKRPKKAPKEEPKGDEPPKDEPQEEDLAPGQRKCEGCGAIIDIDRDGSIEINGKPACPACFEKMTGLPAPEIVESPLGAEGDDAQEEESDDDGTDDDVSEDYTADPVDYEDDKEDYAAELTADGHMGVREDPHEDSEEEPDVEDYGIGVDPDEIGGGESPETPESDGEPEDGEESASDDGSEADPAPETDEEPPEPPETDEEPPETVPKGDEGMERFIESVYEDDSEADPDGKPKTKGIKGGIFGKLPAKPVRRRPKKASEDAPEGDPDGKPKKKAKEIDPESLRGRFDRWYKINFQNYVKLRTLSRNADTGEFRMDLDLIKRKDLPRMAVAVTGEKHTYALDKIRRTEWYLMNHDKSMVPPWEAQFTASDAALYMMSDKMDNALSINWTQQTSTLADNKKIIFLAILGVLAIVLFFMMRHR